MRLASYLDDWLIVNAIRKMLLLDRERLINKKETGVFGKLGEIILNTQSEYNFHRSSIPFSEKYSTSNTRENRQIAFSHSQFDRRSQHGTQFLHLLGLMASCIELIPNARLYMRPIQLHLLHFWRPVKKDMQMILPVTQHLKGHLK